VGAATLKPREAKVSGFQFYLVRFYRAMHVVLARYCYRNVVRPSVRLSVRPSVRDVDVR